MVESRLNGPIKRLNTLTQEARELLNNGSANPNEFNEYSALLLDALNEARSLHDPQDDEGLMPKLRQAILDAEQTKNSLDDLWKKWQPIRKLADKIEKNQEELAAPLESVSQERANDLDEANKKLDGLKVKF